MRIIVALVAVLAGIGIWIVGSLPWLVVNYFLCVPEPALGCARPDDFVPIAQQILIVNVMLLVAGAAAIVYLRRLHQRRQRLQQLLARRRGSRSSV